MGKIQNSHILPVRNLCMSEGKMQLFTQPPNFAFLNENVPTGNFFLTAQDLVAKAIASLLLLP